MSFRNLYNVETLDTRFASAARRPLPDAQAPKWKTPEFFFYYLCFLTIPFFMFKSVYDVSKSSHPSYGEYSHLLEPGWVPGRMVDNSDAQYRMFRNNIPYMAILLILHPLSRQAFIYFRESTSSHKTRTQRSSQSEDNDAEAHNRLRTRVDFDFVFSAILIVILHGVSAVKILAILVINFHIPRWLPQRFAGLATWAFNISILFANEICQGYQFSAIAAIALPADWKHVHSLTAWLDGHGGLIARWEVLFNITVLRLIAFNFDYIWSGNVSVASILEKKNISPSLLSERERVAVGARPEDFSFRNYFAYVLYSPLYIAGPIMGFNDWVHQLRHPLPSTAWARVVPYALRFLISLLTMELVLHYIYAVAISHAKPDWTIYSPFQLSMLGYFNLHLIWLKLLLPWRFFRLWALVDGVDPPENMVRCMSDNFSALAFWRSWHRSFNQFIIRYIYIPLGGSKGSKVRAVLNYLAVFTFVALWHDINLRLLAWGWLITLFVLPEILATLAFPAKNWRNRPQVYRVLCGVGAVGNILMMMAANLVGFVVGLDGLKGLVDGIIGSVGGRLFLISACMTLFVGAQVMFEIRESEKRRGVNMKC